MGIAVTRGHPCYIYTNYQKVFISDRDQFRDMFGFGPTPIDPAYTITTGPTQPQIRGTPQKISHRTLGSSGILRPETAEPAETRLPEPLLQKWTDFSVFVFVNIQPRCGLPWPLTYLLPRWGRHTMPLDYGHNRDTRNYRLLGAVELAHVFCAQKRVASRASLLRSYRHAFSQPTFRALG